MGAFDYQEWIYDGAFEQLFGLGGGNLNKMFQKFKRPGLARGGMFKLRFDWYIMQKHQMNYTAIKIFLTFTCSIKDALYLLEY